MSERFWAKVDKTETCWLWTGYTSKKGYGQFRTATGVLPAHRVAYEMTVDRIPAGLVIDHLCRVRHCVNPAHLEPVTSRENTLRGETLAADQIARTHCAAGHPFDSLNTAHYRGKRVCRACDRASSRAYLARKRAKQLGLASWS